MYKTMHKREKAVVVERSSTNGSLTYQLPKITIM